MGFSFAAGINLYATVAILGLASRYGWVALPPQYQVFDNNWIIGGALVLYVVEFVADKIPWVDSVWDAVHTVIRPIGGALIAVATLGDAVARDEDVVGAARRRARRQHALQQGRHARHGQRQPGAVHELGPQHRRRPVRRRPRALALKYPAAAAIVVIVCVAVIVVVRRVDRANWCGAGSDAAPSHV